jgi:hypothetical protein
MGAALVLTFDKLDESPEISEKIKSAVTDAFEHISTKYELFAVDTREIECRSRDGFISSNDGGWEAIGFTDLSMLSSTGRLYNLPEKARDALEKLYNDCMDMARKEFIRTHKKELEGIPEDKINYHDLYELNKGNLAEKLSEFESDYTSGDDSTVMFEIRAMFGRGSENNGERTLYVSVMVNWEAPYHREKSAFMFAKEVEITTDNPQELISKLHPIVKSLAEMV